MRLATLRTTRGARLHVRGVSGHVDVGDAAGDERLASLSGLLLGGPEALASVKSLTSEAGEPAADFAPAAPETGRVLCLGLNYGEHAREAGWMPPSWPEPFIRGRQSLVGPYDDIVKPGLSSQLDFEGELGVVIGKGGRYIPEDRALEAVLGFTVLNEVTARDWQRASKQWAAGKNFDSTMPIGPEIVTPDEVDVSDLIVTTLLNGVTMQNARTSQMLTSVARSIEFFSSFTRLVPGDVIATGTPAGVGFARTPPIFLQAGDLVEVTIEGIGSLRNRVVDELDAPTDWPWAPVLTQDTKL
jgi:2-keto-4-pentenoate hydratase/2-oxohepta-3-ene-1,7-dioic acid hydratase in catechol pathway